MGLLRALINNSGKTLQNLEKDLEDRVANSDVGKLVKQQVAHGKLEAIFGKNELTKWLEAPDKAWLADSIIKFSENVQKIQATIEKQVAQWLPTKTQPEGHDVAVADVEKTTVSQDKYADIASVASVLNPKTVEVGNALAAAGVTGGSDIKKASGMANTGVNPAMLQNGQDISHIG